MSLTIYGIAASRAFRVLWAARELGLSYEHVGHHFKGPDVRQPGYLAVHPLGLVPAIVDDGFPLFESLAINLYLARKAGRLWPATLQGEGLVYQWTLFAAAEVEVPMGQWFYHTTFLPEAERKPDIAADAAGKLPRRLDALESALGGRAWLADDAFSIADLNLAAVLFRAPLFGLDRWPGVKDWHARCYARPAARAAVADREARA
ncbi:glutathione S-transferase [Burkholderiales bacterium]|nr:glutathione S-transferase [Burkholderiales bacterium]